MTESIFPLANREQRKKGWTYSYEFIRATLEEFKRNLEKGHEVNIDHIDLEDILIAAEKILTRKRYGDAQICGSRDQSNC